MDRVRLAICAARRSRYRFTATTHYTFPTVSGHMLQPRLSADARLAGESPNIRPPIVNWQTNRTITRKIKVVALLSMGGLLGISLLLGINEKVLLLQGAVLSIVGVFLWRQKEPEGPENLS